MGCAKPAFQCSLNPTPLLGSPPTSEHAVHIIQVWGGILAQSLSSCVILGKSLSLSLFPHLENQDNPTSS